MSTTCRYFLSLAAVPDSEHEVTQDEFVQAERSAGFRPKPGLGPVATGGFSNGSVRGRVEYVAPESDE